MMQALQQGRIIRDSPTSIMMVRDFAAHKIGVGGAVLETDLIDVLGAWISEQTSLFKGSETGSACVAHGVDALKVTALEARSRLLSASMIISANAGCWLTR